MSLKSKRIKQIKEKSNSFELAKTACMAAYDKKGEDITLLDVSKLTVIADYFLIITANSAPQIQSIAKSIVENLENYNINLISKEGLPDSDWTILDFGEIIIHIMSKDERAFYKLESFWRNATFIDNKLWKKAS
ncbi:MAG: ribosome silencing factor [Candidatus Melainabacteria bacterium]|nr:ribosome silencing factor [Candidatus Melainabacteria bacterium]